MDKIIITSKTEIANIVGDELEKRLKKHLGNRTDDIENEKISKSIACKIIGLSMPTLNILIRQKVFKQHSLGRKKYLLRSEVIHALKNME